MATIRFLGTAVAAAQVDTFTPADVEVDDIFTLTVTGFDGSSHSVNFTATAATVANVTAGLESAWNDETHALCTPITAADNTTNLTLTADTAGVAFKVASTTTDGGGTDDQTLTREATTKNEGPSDWSSTANWSGGALPGGAADQDVYIEDSDVDILYGLDQSGISNALDSLNIAQSYTGKIASNGAYGAAGDYLQIKTSALNIGYNHGPGNPAGSGRIKIDLGSTACTVIIDNAGINTDTAKPSIRLLANNAATNIRVRKGKVGIAFEAGETATVGTITPSFVSQKTTDADVYIGPGVTMTTLDQTGGDVISQCAMTTATTGGGTLKTEGSGAITTMNVKGGTVTSNSTGTITTVNATGGTTDFTKSVAARTVTTLKIEAGATLKYDPNDLTITNKVDSDNPVKLTATAV